MLARLLNSRLNERVALVNLPETLDHLGELTRVERFACDLDSSVDPSELQLAESLHRLLIWRRHSHCLRDAGINALDCDPVSRIRLVDFNLETTTSLQDPQS